MNDVIKFTVLGRPQAKQRPKFSRRGKHITTYTPKETQTYEKLVRKSALEQCKEQLDKEYVGAVKLKILAFYEPPKSYSNKKKKLLMNNPYLKKSDADNIAKIICDSLNKVAYYDDSQIYSLEVYKYYSEKNRVEVIIEYVEEKYK